LGGVAIGRVRQNEKFGPGSSERFPFRGENRREVFPRATSKQKDRGAPRKRADSRESLRASEDNEVNNQTKPSLGFIQKSRVRPGRTRLIKGAKGEGNANAGRQKARLNKRDRHQMVSHKVNPIAGRGTLRKKVYNITSAPKDEVNKNEGEVQKKKVCRAKHR